MSKSYEKYRVSKEPIGPSAAATAYVPAYEKYRITPAVSAQAPKEETSWYQRPAQFGKGAIKGAAGNLALLADLAPIVTSPIDAGIRAYKGQSLFPFSTTAQKLLESRFPTPNENDELGRFLNTAGEFTGGMASLPIGPLGAAKAGVGIVSKGANLLKNLSKNAGKNAALGAGMGTVAGGLEALGEEPGTAGLTGAIGVPLALYGGKASLTPFLNRFTKGGKKAVQEMTERRVSDILKHQVGEKNIPKVVENLAAPTPLGVNPLTAEAGQNVGLANLHRALNLPEAAEISALNDLKLRKNLGTIGKTGLESEQTGENIRGLLSKQLEEAKAIRGKTTKPLYEKVTNIEKGIPLANSVEYLNSASQNAVGDTKKTLNYIENLLLNNSQKHALESISKQYGNLGVEAQNQIKSQLLPANKPVKLENAIKDINGRLGKALRTGDNNTARILEEAKAAINLDLQTVPEAQIARSTYHKLSKPVSAIEQEPLLKRFVKKDIYGNDFITPPEKITSMVFSSSPRHVRAFMDKVKGHPEVLGQVRGALTDNLLKSTELSSITATGEHNLSYPKLKNYLTTKKKVLKEVLAPDQLKVLEDVQEVLRRRNQAFTLGKGAGSDTVPKATLLQAIGADSGLNVTKWLPRSPEQKAASAVYDYLQGFKKQEVQTLLEKAMLDPKLASTLLTRVEDIRTPAALNKALQAIYGANIGAAREEEE